MNPGQYENFNSGNFQKRNKPYKNRLKTEQNSTFTEIIRNNCKKPGNLVRDCRIPRNKQLKTPHQENFKALPSTGALRKA